MAIRMSQLDVKGSCPGDERRYAFSGLVRVRDIIFCFVPFPRLLSFTLTLEESASKAEKNEETDPA